MVPSGVFLIRGHLEIPKHVTLERLIKAPGCSPDPKNSTLLAVEGKGKEDGTPFITLNSESTPKGVRVLYPEQSRKTPVPYPWCVRGKGDNCSIVNVFMVNPWQAVDFGTNACGRHFINGLYGQPLHTGIFIDQCYDVGRIENVHFWCFWSQELMAFTKKQGTAFIFARTDFQFVSNCFCWDYKVGFLFTSRKCGPGGVVINNSSPDGSEVGVRVEGAQWHAGATFNNCFIWGRVEVEESNYGPVKFIGCGIAPKAGEPGNARLAGSGQVTFNDCHFVCGSNPVIASDCKGLNITNCDFMGQDTDWVGRNPEAGTIALGPNSKATVITGNRFRGGLRLKNAGKGQVQMGLNIDGE